MVGPPTYFIPLAFFFLLFAIAGILFLSIIVPIVLPSLLPSYFFPSFDLS